MCTATTSAAACAWIQAYVALAADEEDSREDYARFKGLLISLPLLRPFTDAFVMQAALLDPPVHEVGAALAAAATAPAIWAQPTVAFAELRLARSRCQLTAAATYATLRHSGQQNVATQLPATL
mgnify:CR=1 FL=1